MGEIREKLRTQLQDQQTDKIERPHENKYFPCLIYVMLVIGPCLLLIFVPTISFQLGVAANQRTWLQSGIGDYTISIIPIGYAIWTRETQYGLYVRVEDGRVVEGSSGDCTQRVCLLEDYQQYTVDWLFNEAYGCVILCSVEFDPTYGYPARIKRGFIEGGWLEITLEPITSTESNTDR